jgi:hypothetical protein
MRAAALALALLVAACSPPSPAVLDVRVSCEAHGRALSQLCTVSLADRKSGRPVEGATVTMQADMPSMPLAHSSRPVTATPGDRRGTYRGTLELEMTGRWVITVRITGPVKDQVTHTLDIN